jgi:hypothetical protein
VKWEKVMTESNKPFFDYQRELGVAVWLFLLYWQNHSSDDTSEWMQVADGRVVQDAESATMLGVSVHTAIRWRRRLTESGLVRARSCGRGAFLIWILNLDRPQDDEVPRREWPEMQSELVQ